jgi:hypothetical protein
MPDYVGPLFDTTQSGAPGGGWGWGKIFLHKKSPHLSIFRTIYSMELDRDTYTVVFLNEINTFAGGLVKI